MFERYNEKARQVLLLACEEAKGLRSSMIETHHLLFSLLQLDQDLRKRVLFSPEPLEQLGMHFAAQSSQKHLVPPITLPFSKDSKRCFNYVFEEADLLGHSQIGPEHLLVGLFREEQGMAGQVLREQGWTLNQLRQEVISDGQR